MAIVAVVLCAGSLGCGCFTSLPGMLIAYNELEAIKQGRSSADGKVLAQVALGLGIATTALSLLGFLGYFLFAIVAVAR